MDKIKEIDYDKPIFIHEIDSESMSRHRREAYFNDLINMYKERNMQVVVIPSDKFNFECVYSKNGIYSTNAYSLIKDLKSIDNIDEIDNVLKVHFRDEIINDILSN